MSTHEIREVPLDDRAADYIGEKLKHGNSLAGLLSTRDDLVQGPVSTYLPFNPDPGPLYSFDLGIFPESRTDSTTPRGIWVPTPNVDATLVALLREFLGRDKSNVAVFEEYLLRSEDLGSDGIETKTMTYGREVYHVLAYEDARNESLVGATIKRACTWQFLGAMSSMPSNSTLSQTTDTTEEVLRALAKRTTSLIIGAYDGESFLISRL